MDEGKRIEIQAKGPYVVYGGVPLKTMAPVQTFNGEPVAWHTLDEQPEVDATYELCRCGQSQTKPFCDKSHESTAFDGAETASRAPYRDRAKTVENDAEVLADDKSLCVDAGFCGTRTRQVWKMFQTENDPSQREEMRQMVFRCPSGRFALFRKPDDAPVEPELAPEIAIIPGGPMWVRGGIKVVGADGAEWETRNRVTLCRCGQSANKPYCDLSHEKAHFDER